LRYPDDAPSLQPGTPYYVVVTDGNGRSSEEEKDASALDLSFVLMGDAEIADLNSLLAQVNGLAINDLAKALLISEIYHARSLRTDAIAQLQSTMPTVMSPAVQQRLADLYLAVGLYLEAEQAFNDAVDAYRTLGDIAGEAYSLAGLGLARRGLLQDGAAIQDLETAAALYQQLNDLGAYEQTQERLNSIRGAP
jgi:tetratricopeptide (TPR) repeat protein